MQQSQSQPDKKTFLVVDDHVSVLGGTISVLHQEYPGANIITAQNCQEALQKVKAIKPHLIVVDLVMPNNAGDTAQANTGIQLLKTLMEKYPTLNIVVQTAHVRMLVWLKPAIDSHQGGFTVVDKSASAKDMLTMVDWSLRERTYTPREIKNGVQLKLEWLEVLRLGCQEGLQDAAIAKRMNVHEKTVQNYWAKIRDVLEVYQDSDMSLRMQTQIKAREAGLID